MVTDSQPCGCSGNETKWWSNLAIKEEMPYKAFAVPLLQLYRIHRFLHSKLGKGTDTLLSRKMATKVACTPAIRQWWGVFDKSDIGRWKGSMDGEDGDICLGRLVQFSIQILLLCWSWVYNRSLLVWNARKIQWTCWKQPTRKPGTRAGAERLVGLPNIAGIVNSLPLEAHLWEAFRSLHDRIGNPNWLKFSTRSQGPCLRWKKAGCSIHPFISKRDYVSL